MEMTVREFMIRVYSGALLVIWILAPYALLQHVEIREVVWIQPTAFDRAIPVNFHSLWFYLSFYALLGWVGLRVERAVYFRYLLTIGWTTFVCHMVFLFYPNGVARGEIDVAQAPVVYQYLAMLDQPRNAFPSLHAALAVIAGLGAAFSCRFGAISKMVAWVWVCGIFWSTIALRQHVAYDLLAGGLLAYFVWWLMPRLSWYRSWMK